MGYAEKRFDNATGQSQFGSEEGQREDGPMLTLHNVLGKGAVTHWGIFLVPTCENN